MTVWRLAPLQANHVCGRESVAETADADVPHPHTPGFFPGSTATPARRLISHALGIADRLELQTPRRLEVEDRLAGNRAILDGERPKAGFDATHVVQIGFGSRDVADIEGDVEGADVAVLLLEIPLVGGRNIRRVSRFEPLPQRIMATRSMRARGWTPSASVMKLPSGRRSGRRSAHGYSRARGRRSRSPHRGLGTVKPVWSWPTRPGRPFCVVMMVLRSGGVLVLCFAHVVLVKPLNTFTRLARDWAPAASASRHRFRAAECVQQQARIGRLRGVEDGFASPLLHHLAEAHDGDAVAHPRDDERSWLMKAMESPISCDSAFSSSAPAPVSRRRGRRRSRRQARSPASSARPRQSRCLALAAEESSCGARVQRDGRQRHAVENGAHLRRHRAGRWQARAGKAVR